MLKDYMHVALLECGLYLNIIQHYSIIHTSTKHNIHEISLSNLMFAQMNHVWVHF